MTEPQGKIPLACWLGEVSQRSSSISLKSIKLVNHSDNPNRTEIGQGQGGLVRYLSVTRNRTPIFKSWSGKKLSWKDPEAASDSEEERESSKSQGAHLCQDAHRVSIFQSAGPYFCLSSISMTSYSVAPTSSVKPLGNAHCPASCP